MDNPNQDNNIHEKNDLDAINELMRADQKESKKRKIKIIAGLAIASVIILIILLSASNNNNNSPSGCNHSYSVVERPEAHCSYTRDILYRCDYCDAYRRDVGAIPAIGHVWEAATCTSIEKCKICSTPKDPTRAPLGHKWIPATCTSNKKCSVCGEVSLYSSLGHSYTNTTDGTCIRCDHGVKFILPETPITISYYSQKACKIESITIERIKTYSSTYYKLTFMIESTYHYKGSNYSDTAYFGWKLYDEDGLVIASGTGYSDGDIKVGEKSKETKIFYVGSDEKIQDGKTYTFVLLNIN